MIRDFVGAKAPRPAGQGMIRDFVGAKAPAPAGQGQGERLAQAFAEQTGEFVEHAVEFGLV